MGIKFPFKKTISSKQKGFTLLELIVVMAGLGILSSLAIPNFIALLDSNKVDEIKALLNSAAADCLQSSRSTTDPLVDDEIISDEIIEKIGYIIDTNEETGTSFKNGKPRCSRIILKPINGDVNDSVRYNIGFSLSDQILDKLASTEVAEKKADCIRWAGKCESSKAAKILSDHKDKIKESVDICDLQFKDWKENKKMNPSKFKIWDSTKGPESCPKSPPEGAGDAYNPETSSCTTEGCNPGIPVWGLWDRDKDKGTVYYSENDYKEARDALVGEQCAKQIKDEYENANPPFTNPSSQGVRPSKCTQNYWFVDGEITGPAPNGSEEKWKPAMCIKNKQELLSANEVFNDSVEYCEVSPIYGIDGEEILPEASREKAKIEFDNRIANDKEKKCSTLLREDAKTKSTSGPHISPTPADMEPIVGKDCGVSYWYCKKSGQIHRSKVDYDADPKCQRNCTDLRPFSECDREPFFKVPACYEYSKCLGRF